MDDGIKLKMLKITWQLGLEGHDRENRGDYMDALKHYIVVYKLISILARRMETRSRIAALLNERRCMFERITRLANLLSVRRVDVKIFFDWVHTASGNYLLLHLGTR